MSDCCETNAAPAKAKCPVSGTQGRPVGHKTLESLLVDRAKGLIDTDASYYFCPEASCAVVYYAADGDQTFVDAELSVPVWQKSPANLDVFVCYCFEHTPGSIAKELEATGKSTVVADISAKMKAGLCDCEHNNPQGSCCLGNVNSVVTAAKKQAFTPKTSP